jgi:prevent-host-death family protein
MVMIQVNIAELKAHLSRYIRMVRRGREVQVLDRRTPVARIVPVEPSADEVMPSRPPLEPFSALELDAVRVRDVDSLEVLMEERGQR